MSPHRRTRHLLLATVIALLAACSSGRNVPDSYGDTTRTNFNEGCVATLTSPTDTPGTPLTDDAARRVCGCAYTSISDPDTGIPFEEFNAIDEQLSEDPAPLPPPIRDRVQDCAGDEEP